MVRLPPDVGGETSPGRDRPYQSLTPREQSVLDVVEQIGEGDAGQITAALGGRATHEAVRAVLRVLERKHFLEHTSVGRRHVYRAVPPPAPARTSALRRVVRTFFRGSSAAAAAALLDLDGTRLTPAEAEELGALIARTQREGR